MIWVIIMYNIYTMKRFSIGFVAALSFLSFFVMIFVSQGQTPPQREVLLSWQALNFFPANYEGKPLASPFSPIKVGVEMIENGKLADLSQASISWRLDNKFLKNGVGLKDILFRVQKNKGDFHIVQVSIDRNNIKTEGSILISIVPQTIVVEIPYPGNTVRSNIENSIQAIPYFFNIKSLKDLSFYWQINDRKEGGGTNNTLILKTGEPQTNSQRIIELTASAQNNENPLEFAKIKTWLNVK